MIYSRCFDMISSALQKYLQIVFARVPWEHWTVIAILSLMWTVILLARKRYSVYGSLTLGITVFVGLIILDTAVLIRFGGSLTHQAGLNIVAEYRRLLHGGDSRRIEMLSNVAVFVPFGFFLSEFLSSAKWFSIRRRIGLVALCAFGLSLCIEGLQLAFRLGVFEVTDLVLNTVGAVIGASLSAFGRKVLGRFRARKNQFSKYYEIS